MKKGWKIFAIVMGAIILMIAGFLYWSTWEGSTKEIESVANEFKPGSDWTQVDNQVIPPKTICLDVSCPSVHRSWTTPKLVSRTTLREILGKSGWDFDVQGDCRPDPRISGSGSSVCTAEGEVMAYKVIVDVVGSYDSSSVSRIILRIERNN